jgi:hypothetical protein
MKTKEEMVARGKFNKKREKKSGIKKITNKLIKQNPF